MNHPLARYLRCPDCSGTLTHGTGGLTCKTCKHVFDVTKGVPVLVNLATLPAHMKRQIEYFEKEDASRAAYQLEPWQRRYVDNFLRWGHPKKGGLIIDNATGSGYMAIELAKLGYRVIATDLTLAELMKLSANIKTLRLAHRILPVCASSDALPIQTGCADGEVANAILEHLPDEKKAVDQMRRVLKKGAPLMVAMPIKLAYVWPFLWGVNMVHDRNIGHLRRYSRASVARVFGGFSEVTTYYTGSMFKVAALAMGIITKNKYWSRAGERLDTLVQRIAYGSSNVVCILRKTV